MKSKKLLFSSLLMLGGIATYLTFASSATASQGVMGAANAGTGCGSCHGNNASTNTMINLLLGPTMSTVYVPGNTYTMTLTINSLTGKTKMGYDIKASSGTIANGPSASMIMGSGTELHHTSPETATVISGMSAALITFDWTAPATGSGPVTFKVAANACNGDNGTNGDEWATKTVIFTQIPAAVSNVESTQFNLHPNPATENLTINTDATIQSVKAISLTGSMINLTVSKLSNNEYRVDTKTLATGAYVLLINDGKSTSHKKFIKQ